MNTGNLRPPELNLDCDGSMPVLRLSGDWIACETGVRSPAEVRGILNAVATTGMRIDSAGLGKWDSALIAFLTMLRDFSSEDRASAIQIDDTDLPDTAKRLLALSAESRAGSRGGSRRAGHCRACQRVDWRNTGVHRRVTVPSLWRRYLCGEFGRHC